MLEDQHAFGEGLAVRGVRAASAFAKQSSLPLRFRPARRGDAIRAGGEHRAIGAMKMTYMWSRGAYHGHSQWGEGDADPRGELLLCLCLSGGCEIDVRGAMTIRPGDLVLLPASGPMSMRPMDELATLSFHVPGERLRQSAGGDAIGALYCRPLAAGDGIADIIRTTMLAGWRVRHQLNPVSAFGVVDALGALLRSAAENRYRSFLSLTQSRQSLQWALHEHLSDLLDHGQSVEPGPLAHRLNCSVRALQAALRDAGTTLGKLVMEERLARVAAVLRSPLTRQRNISQIAYAAGFEDISYFNRCFKRRFGMSPGAYRTQAVTPD